MKSDRTGNTGGCAAMKAFMLLFWLTGLFLYCQQREPIDVKDLSLEDLLKVPVSTASMKLENVAEAPGIVTVITRSELEGFSAGHLGDILNRIPGAILLSANIFPQNSVEFRGQCFTPYNNHVLFLLNGRPLRDPITGGLNSPILTGFPVHILERVEVIRGPGSVLYGSCAYAGVINLVTRSPQREGLTGEIGLQGGNQGIFSQEGNLAYRRKNLSLSGSVYRYDDSGPEYAFTDYLGLFHRTRFDRSNLSFVGTLQYKEFQLQGALLRLDQYNLAGADNNWDLVDPYDNNNHLSLMIDAGYRVEIGPDLRLLASLTYNRHVWETDGYETQTGDDLLGELTFTGSPGKTLNLVAGAVFSVNRWNGEKLIAGNLTQGSLYGQLDLRIHRRIKIIAGFQWNRLEGITANVSPRGGVIWTIGRHLGLKLLYSSAFRKGYPLETSFNLSTFRGNLKLEPELIDTLELQFSLDRDSLHLSLCAYMSKTSRMISRYRFEDPAVLPQGWYIQYVNGGTHRFYGLELEGKGNLGPSLFVLGSMSYQGNRSEEGITDAALHPAFMGKFGLLYRSGSCEAGVFNSFFSAPRSVRRIAPDAVLVNPEPSAFNLLGMQLKVDLFRLLHRQKGGRLKLQLAVDNLLGKTVRYPEFTSRGINTLLPLYSGVTVRGGVRCEF